MYTYLFCVHKLVWDFPRLHVCGINTSIKLFIIIIIIMVSINKIVDFAGFCVCLFFAQLARDYVGVQLQLSNYNFL